jgi:hypothetical protein
MSDYEHDETRAALENLFWRARVARDVLDATNADPDERAKAACHWALLYRVVHSRRRETAEGRNRRLDFFESLAAKAASPRYRFTFASSRRASVTQYWPAPTP